MRPELEELLGDVPPESDASETRRHAPGRLHAAESEPR